MNAIVPELRPVSRDHSTSVVTTWSNSRATGKNRSNDAGSSLFQSTLATSNRFAVAKSSGRASDLPKLLKA